MLDKQTSDLIGENARLKAAVDIAHVAATEIQHFEARLLGEFR